MAAVLPTPSTGTPMSGLARALMQAGRLSMPQADALQKKAALEKIAFIDAVISSGVIDAKSLAAFCAETFGYPLLKLTISQVAPILPFLFLVLILIFRPKGLLGTREG